MEDLNYHTGKAGEMITDVVMWAKDNENLKRNVKIRTEDRKSFHTKAKEIKRLSPGFFFTNRKLCLTSDDVYNAVKERADARLHKEKETVRKAIKDRLKAEDTTKRILMDAKRFIQNKPNDFPQGAPQDRALTFEEIPISFLTGTTTKHLLRFLSKKKKGDKPLSKLNTVEAKALWKDHMCTRTPYTLKEFLTEEKGYSAPMVEAVLSEAQGT